MSPSCSLFTASLLYDNYGRLIDFLSQFSKLSYLNLLDLPEFLMHACIASFMFRFLMWQPCAWANTAAHLCLQYVHHFELCHLIGSSGGLIITAHTTPYLFCPPSSCIQPHNKKQNFLAYFTRILNSCVVYKFQTVKGRRPPSQPHTFSDRKLFDKTFAWPDVFAVVSCRVLALSVFYSTVLMRSLIFLQL